MKNLVFLILIICLVSCNTKETELIKAQVNLSNISLKPFEQAYFAVKVNGDIMIEDLIVNEYLAHEWNKYDINVEPGRSKVSVEVLGDSFHIRKDTLLDFQNGLELFVRLNFKPFEKIRDDLVLYTYLDSTKSLNEIVDSLYSAGKISEELAKDSIPSSNDIEIIVRHSSF